MLFGQTPHETRALFFISWKKYKHHQPLEALERQLVDVICMHPEYHVLLEQDSNDWMENGIPSVNGTNPFLHMGLHLAIREQVALNRPYGITEIYQTLLQKHQDPCNVEHLLMEPLAACLWHSQQHQIPPDEITYLQECLKFAK